MEKKSTIARRVGELHLLPGYYPAPVIRALVEVARTLATDAFLVGGTVRDWLLGRAPGDLDLTTSCSAESFCRSLIRELGGGALVRLGTTGEEAVRVVWQGLDIDVSTFRGGATTLEEDLGLRDFTINAMAADLVGLVEGVGGRLLVDPLGGRADLEAGVLRHCPRAFIDDPLRLLRGYRFMATRGMELAQDTEREIRREAGKISRVAAERIRYELDLIMAASSGAEALWRMHEAGLLRVLLPELYAGEGVEQPGFHHLDVFHHSFLALREIEHLVVRPQRGYPESRRHFSDYLRRPRIGGCLKWAALCHDIGKPAARGGADGENSRVTFYGHDEIGREIFTGLARRLKWSNEDRLLVENLIAMHMHPFHLCNVRRTGDLSRRAVLKLCRRAGEHLPGLFLLAMADSLASRGELKPAGMEAELADLYREVQQIVEEHIRPAASGPPLLRGRDLIEEFKLQPGPVFSRILDELQVQQIEGRLSNRHEALAWVADFLRLSAGKGDH